MPVPLSCIYKLSVTLCKHKQGQQYAFYRNNMWYGSNINMGKKKDSFEKLSFNILKVRIKVDRKSQQS